MTTNTASLNRTLFLEDNLPVLRGLDSKSVDLIATDPPFNKGMPAFEGTTKAGVNVEFKDVWNWDDDVHTDWTNALSKKHPSLYNVIHYTNAAAGDDMGAFLCWMAVRMLEMDRVLKDTGSIYLHCDPTASHYLKAMMDAIFGRKNFRNEIVWHYGGRGGKAIARQFPRNHDIILFYSKNVGSHVHERQYTIRSFTPKEARDRGYRQDEDGRWFRTAPRGNYTDASIEKLEAEGRIYRTAKGTIRIKYFLDSGSADEVSEDVLIGDTWLDIVDMMHTPRKERTGYPTQKPLALYKRMVEASSNPGDMVLDPFAGCATTCVAAEQLGRQWIGIDIREEAGEVILDRLQNEVINGSMAWNDIVRVLTEAPERTDDGEPVDPELVVTSQKKDAPKIPVSEVRKQLIVRDGMRCQGCGWVPPYADHLERDHKKPTSLGGKDEMPNYALLCSPCNLKKSNKLSLAELRQARKEEDRIDAKWYEESARWE